MRTESSAARWAVVVCLAVWCAPVVASGQNGDPDRPFSSAFSHMVRSWVDTRVPDPNVFDAQRGGMSFVSLFSARTFGAQSRITVGRSQARFDRLDAREANG